MSRIVYNKEKSTKIMGGGGPRDRQAGLKLMHDRQLLQNLSPSIQAEVSKAPVESSPQVDMSQYLPLDIVRQKIEAAVQATRDQERERYESGLRNLNDQLKDARKKAAIAEENLLNTSSEIKKLKTDLLESSSSVQTDIKRINDQELMLRELKAELKSKTDMVLFLESQLRDKVSSMELLYKETAGTLKEKEVELAELKQKMKSADELKLSTVSLEHKLDELYQKISDGSISHLVGSKMDRPALEDKIFIDPLEKNKEPELESHIEVKKEEAATIARDVPSDLNKLRNLLKL